MVLYYLHTHSKRKKNFFILRNFNARKIRQINIEALDDKVTRVGSVTFCDPFIQKTYKISFQNEIWLGQKLRKVSDDAHNMIVEDGIF